MVGYPSMRSAARRWDGQERPGAKIGKPCMQTEQIEGAGIRV